MAQPYSDHELWLQEQPIINEAKKTNPHLFTFTSRNPEQLRNWVGISLPHSDTPLPLGFVKYSPLDFIVEEILTDGTVVEVEGNIPPLGPIMPGEGTIYATLVKVGPSTLDAIRRLSDTFNLDVSRIGYAGIKDATALTAQRISLRNIDQQTLLSKSAPGIILRDYAPGKGALNAGQLQGNRFSLFIRTKDQVNPLDFKNKLFTLQQTGVINFYGTQRFGSPRLLSHLYGRLLLSGQYQELIRVYLCQASPYEYPYVANLRSTAAVQFGNWQAMDKIFSQLPYTFRFERTILRALQQSSGTNQFINAIHSVSVQADFWTRAYTSYLANLVLSQNTNPADTTPLPIFLSQDPAAIKPYYHWLVEDQTLDFRTHIRPFPFIRIGKSVTVPPRIFPKFHAFRITPHGVALSFSLPKGAYATTVLMHLFDSTDEPGLPTWLNTDEVDSKHMLNLGNIQSVRQELSEAIAEIMSKRDKAEESE